MKRKQQKAQFKLAVKSNVLLCAFSIRGLYASVLQSFFVPRVTVESLERVECADSRFSFTFSGITFNKSLLRNRA